MMRIGHGYDVHKFAQNRRLIICGVDIPYEMGLLGHSDADVAAHAVMDALLGSAALPDIGHIFPDNDPAFEGADSLELLKKVIRILSENGLRPSNIDVTVIAQKPKMAPYIMQMRQNLASACGLDIGFVNVKATTEERLGFTGSMQGIAAHAVCLTDNEQ